MTNEDTNPHRPLDRSEKKRVRIFEPFKWGALPGFWVYLIGSIFLTAAVAVGGAWLLVRMGVQ
jgi:hypothetical protein